MSLSRFHRFIVAVVAFASLAFAAAAPAQAPQASVRPKVVLQMSEADPAKWSLALNNANNIQTDLGPAKLTQADMLNKISYVQAGVVEIMQKQQQGWAYIRP